MIVISNLNDKFPPERSTALGSKLLASFDVEWTKNFRVKNSNIPFCYSFVFLEAPAVPMRLTHDLKFWVKSAYVESTEETQALITTADDDMWATLQSVDLLVGHQLTSDLAALRNAANRGTPNLDEAYRAWVARKDRDCSLVLDTRYDVPFSCESRRLVDVCEASFLDVSQPELNGSMTRMHRNYLSKRDPETRERLAVLNVRHSLSTALVALQHLKRYRWSKTVNVNRIMFANLRSHFEYVDTPEFAELLTVGKRN